MDTKDSFPLTASHVPGLNNTKVSHINSFYIGEEQKVGAPSVEDLPNVTKFCILEHGRQGCYAALKPVEEEEKKDCDFLCNSVDPTKAKCWLNIKEKKEADKICGIRAISSGMTQSVCLN